MFNTTRKSRPPPKPAEYEKIKERSRRRSARVANIGRDIGPIPDVKDLPRKSADPPYIREGDRYVHTFTPAQHRELAELLRRFSRTRVVLSYYADPLLAELYPGWTVLDSTYLRMAKSMVNSGSTGSSHRRRAHAAATARKA